MKISVILGTRPEIIKMAPIIKELKKQKKDFSIIHTGQHYSYEMDRIFFEELELPQPLYNLEVGSGTHGVQTGRMLERIETTFMEDKPEAILVQGDTNTVMAGALAAVKLGIKAGHVEAGLRSFDRSMPEEINRVVADHVCDFLYPPTESAKENLLKEGIPENKIFVTGNTVVDAVSQNLEISLKKKNTLDQMGLKSGNYILVTVHRQENVDNKDRFKGILEGLAKVSHLGDYQLIYPIHPRTRKMIGVLKLQDHLGDISNLMACEPLGYLEFLQLEAKAGLIITDSGGIQEEACILKVPCVTLRDNTERPETIDAGSNMLAGTDPDRILHGAQQMLNARRDWENPFGDGNSAKRIVDLIARET